MRNRLARNATNPRILIAQQGHKRLGQRFIRTAAHEPRHSRAHRRIGIARQLREQRRRGLRPKVREKFDGPQSVVSRVPLVGENAIQFRLPAIAQLAFDLGDASPRPIAFELRLVERFLNSLAEANRLRRLRYRSSGRDKCRRPCRVRPSQSTAHRPAQHRAPSH